MTDPVFEAHYLGTRVSVYPDRIDWKVLSASNSIPISQVASIELPPLYRDVQILTTGGKRYTIPIGKKDKQPLHDAILEQMRRPNPDGSSVPTNLDELKKLGELKQSGVITEEEFQTKKRELLK